MVPKLVGRFHGIRIYEASWMGQGYHSAGLTLPGVGILVGKGVMTEKLNYHLLMHEYGHILQYREIGFWRFYLLVGIPSLISAWTNGYGKGHQQYWTEYWCNYLAKSYFSEYCWRDRFYPPQDIHPHTKRWLGL